MSNQITKKTWEEFRGAGLLWLINTTLHVFGWAIVFEFEEGSSQVSNVYPARVKFRGFSEEANDENLVKVTEYMVKNAQDLLNDLEEYEHTR